MKTRSILIVAAGAALFAMPAVAGGAADKTAADAAWCRSSAAGLSNLDATRCVDRMNAAKTEQERKQIQSAFLAGSGSGSSLQSSGGRSSASPQADTSVQPQIPNSAADTSR